MNSTLRYPVVGAFLALGAPFGLLLLHAIIAHTIPGPSWLAAEFESRGSDYAYVTLSTMTVFTILGWRLGSQEQQLEASAFTDPLTGLWNRRYVVSRLAEELQRVDRHGQPLSLLFVDVNGLKQINDRGGHLAGDHAIKLIAEAIHTSCRTSDIAARYGGDEFAVLAPHTHGADGVALAERILRAVRLGAAGSTVSIGVADLKDATAPDVSALCLAADRALYRAKTLGRNQVSRAQQTENAISVHVIAREQVA